MADVTGLDRVGLPVVMVVRPDSLSLCVAQGKGLDRASAEASGLMESIETWSAERVRPQLTASLADLGADARVADTQMLPPRRESRFRCEVAIPWVAAVDLMHQQSHIWVPFALVHSDFGVPPAPGSGCFCASTNGLAAGNSVEEALIHGISEIIERDALAIWHHRSAEYRAGTQIDLLTIDDADSIEVLERLEAADMAVSIFNATSDVGVPVIHAEIVERGLKKPLFFPHVTSGDGCHPARSIAMVRALTEAVQSRLTYISGSRDDITDVTYRNNDLSPRRTDRQAEHCSTQGKDFRCVPTFDSDDFSLDLRHLLHRLAMIGISQVAMVDLSRPEVEQVAVVRVVIPGLATMVDHPHAAHWHRLPDRPQIRTMPSTESMM